MKPAPDRRIQIRDIARESEREVREFLRRYNEGDFCRYCNGFTRHALHCPVGHGADR